MARGLRGRPGLSAPRLVVTVSSLESENVTILNQLMAGNLVQEHPLFSRIVWRKNVQVRAVLYTTPSKHKDHLYQSSILNSVRVK